MKTVKLKRHPINFYFSIYFGLAFFLVLATAMVYLEITKISSTGGKEYILLLTGISLLALGIYTVYSYYKNVPMVHATEKNITVKNIHFSYDNIDVVYFTGKFPFKYVTQHPMEGMSILLKNGTVINLFDNMYSNLAEFKRLLDKKPNNTFQDNYGSKFIFTKNKILDFKGIYFLSPTGILFLLFSFLTVVLLSTSPYFGVLFLGLTYLILKKSNNYFSLREKQLLVKSHVIYWQKAAYDLSDIREIVIEQTGKTPIALRIILKNYTSTVYYASSLSESKWLNMQEELEKRNIIVRNEI